MPNNNQNPLDLKINSLNFKVYDKFFNQNFKDKKSLALQLGSTQNSISSIVSILNKRINALGMQNNQSESSVGALNTPSTVNHSNQTHLELEFCEENDELYIKVKTSVEFENYLKSKKEIKETKNLWGLNQTGQYYHMSFLPESLDDINRPIVYNRQINAAILRIVGISDGVKFRIDNLISEKNIILALKRFKTAFSGFYKMNIIGHKINLKLTVEEEI